MPLPSGRRGPTDMLLALLVHERNQQAVRAALPAGTRLHVLSRAAELRQPWREGEPTAVLAALSDADGRPLAPALATFHERAPAVPVCAFVPLTAAAMHEAVQLAVRRLVTDVIVARGEDLRAHLRQLLRRGHVRGETAALRHVWRPCTPPAMWNVVAGCIAASGHAASVAGVARGLNRSPSTLKRQLAHAGLPSAHRALSWCRLLRAAHRLDRPLATVKVVSAELGYPSPHAFAHHLYRYAGLTVSELRTSGGFRGLAACLQTELLTARAHGSLHRRGRRQGSTRVAK